MTKLDRILATLNHQPVDRCAVLEQLSYNPPIPPENFRAMVEVVKEEQRHAIR
jgi:hypothetical protein